MSKRSGIQLCYPLEERRLTDPKFGWMWPVIVQPKLDGERCRVILERGSPPLLLSSECNQIISVPHITDALSRLSEYKELDGELYAHGLTFPEIHSIVSRQSEDRIHDEAWRINLHVFDIIDETMIQAKRTITLEDMKLEPPIVSVPYDICYTYAEVMERYVQYLNEGVEGIILRHPMKPYVRKRSTFMLKFKPKKTDDYIIVEVVEAVDKNGMKKGMVGAFRCKSPDEDTLFGVGAGCLSHDQRIEMWRQREEIVGRWLRVQYQHLTPAKIPRFGLALEVIAPTGRRTDGY